MHEQPSGQECCDLCVGLLACLLACVSESWLRPYLCVGVGMYVRARCRSVWHGIGSHTGCRGAAERPGAGIFTTHAESSR